MNIQHPIDVNPKHFTPCIQQTCCMDNILYYCMQKSSLNISSIYLHIWICAQLFLVSTSPAICPTKLTHNLLDWTFILKMVMQIFQMHSYCHCSGTLTKKVHQTMWSHALLHMHMLLCVQYEIVHRFMCR